MWRPENWERIIDKAVLTEAINIMDGGQVELAAGRLFEAGADAMLKAIRERGFIVGKSLRNVEGAIGWSGIASKSKWYPLPEEE